MWCQTNLSTQTSLSCELWGVLTPPLPPPSWMRETIDARPPSCAFAIPWSGVGQILSENNRPIASCHQGVIPRIQARQALTSSMPWYESHKGATEANVGNIAFRRFLNNRIGQPSEGKKPCLESSGRQSSSRGVDQTRFQSRHVEHSPIGEGRHTSQGGRPLHRRWEHRHP